MTLLTLITPWHKAVVIVFRIALPLVLVLGSFVLIVYVMHKDAKY